MIVERGSLREVQGETGQPLTVILMARIAEETQKFNIKQATGHTQQLSDLDKYLAEAPVEPYAAQRLRELPREMQLEVMNRRSIRRCRDPTMLLLGLIAQVTREGNQVAAAPAAPAAPSRS